jgi:hypothetical protein
MSGPHGGTYDGGYAAQRWSARIRPDRMTARKATPAPEGAAHETLIVPGSAYTVKGPNTGRPANLRNPAHYPAEAICQVCFEVVERAEMEPGKLDWEHTGRKAGE